MPYIPELENLTRMGVQMNAPSASDIASLTIAASNFIGIVLTLIRACQTRKEIRALKQHIIKEDDQMRD